MKKKELEKEKTKGYIALVLFMFLSTFISAYAGVGYSVMSNSAFLGYLFTALVMFLLVPMFSLANLKVKLEEKTKRNK